MPRALAVCVFVVAAGVIADAARAAEPAETQSRQPDPWTRLETALRSEGALPVLLAFCVLWSFAPSGLVRLTSSGVLILFGLLGCYHWSRAILEYQAIGFVEPAISQLSAWSPRFCRWAIPMLWVLAPWQIIQLFTFRPCGRRR